MKYTHSDLTSMRVALEKLSLKDKGQVLELKKAEQG